MSYSSTAVVRGISVKTINSEVLSITTAAVVRLQQYYVVVILALCQGTDTGLASKTKQGTPI